MFQTHLSPSAGFAFPGRAVVYNNLLHASSEVNSTHPLVFYSVKPWGSTSPDQCREGSSGLKRLYIRQSTKVLTSVIKKDRIVSTEGHIILAEFMNPDSVIWVAVFSNL